MNSLKTWIFLLVCLLGSQAAVQAQKANIPSDTLKPYVLKLDFQDDTDDSTQQATIATPGTAYRINPFDKQPITLHRKKGSGIRLEVKGRGSLNHVLVHEKDAAEDAFPIIDETFRGVNVETIDLSNLKPGEYIIEIVSPHTVTETALHIL